MTPTRTNDDKVNSGDMIISGEIMVSDVRLSDYKINLMHSHYHYHCCSMGD